MIIVEGPDGAGKSTLIRKLLTDVPELNLGARATANRDLLYTVTRPDTYRAIRDGVDPYAPVYIWDRLYYSELVYCSVQRRECQFNATEQVFFHRMIEGIHAPFILCLPEYQVVLDNVAGERHDMPGVKEGINFIYSRYNEMWHEGSFPDHVMLYDYTAEEYDQVLEDVQDYIDEKQARRR